MTHHAWIVLIAALAAGSASAEVAAGTSRSALEQAAFQTPRAEAYAQSNSLRAAGLARTALERRIRGDTVTGAVGFLCGREPSRDLSAGGGAFGSDPHGRFVGAKLSLRFR